MPWGISSRKIGRGVLLPDFGDCTKSANYILPRKLSAKLRADYIGLLVQFLPNGYAMLMRPNKAETVVHGCHCLADMAVRICKVLARPWVGV